LRSSVPAFLRFNFSLWRDSLLAAMVVNALAFFVLARPWRHLARWVGTPRRIGDDEEFVA